MQVTIQSHLFLHSSTIPPYVGRIFYEDRKVPTLNSSEVGSCLRITLHSQKSPTAWCQCSSDVYWEYWGHARQAHCQQSYHISLLSCASHSGPDGLGRQPRRATRQWEYTPGRAPRSSFHPLHWQFISVVLAWSVRYPLM